MNEVFKGFQVTIYKRGFADWVAIVTHPEDSSRWQGSGSWTRWGARYDARWVISRYLAPGRLRKTGLR